MVELNRMGAGLNRRMQNVSVDIDSALNYEGYLHIIRKNHTADHGAHREAQIQEFEMKYLGGCFFRLTHALDVMRLSCVAVRRTYM